MRSTLIPVVDGLKKRFYIGSVQVVLHKMTINTEVIEQLKQTRDAFAHLAPVESRFLRFCLSIALL